MSLSLRLKNDQVYCLIPGDEEAATIIQFLSVTMQAGSEKSPTHLRIVVTHDPFVIHDSNCGSGFPLFFSKNNCTLQAYHLKLFVKESPDVFFIQVNHLASMLGRDIQQQGGIVLHGALAEFSGKGVLFIGPGGVGKSTASRRLPLPWHSLSDDATLIVPDSLGQYWAHPWPTWTRFLSGGEGGSWNVQRAVPLHAFVYLSQAPVDQIEPLDTLALRISLLLETAQQVAATPDPKQSELEVAQIHQKRMEIVQSLACAIPTYLLHISLTGTFWKEIERMAFPDQQPLNIIRPDMTPINTCPAGIELQNRIILTGTSMIPTLHEADILEVVPYFDRKVQPGDIIYFFVPGKKSGIVHRVIRVMPEGIRTRGDHGNEDPYLLQREDIQGQVVAIQRDTLRKPIAGGWCGYFIHHWLRVSLLVLHYATQVLHKIYHTLSRILFFRYFLPGKFRPRIILFKTKDCIFYKILMGKRVIGYYNFCEQQWMIYKPFRLLVDETQLPHPSIAQSE